MVLDLRLTKGVGCRETVNTRFIAPAHLIVQHTDLLLFVL